MRQALRTAAIVAAVIVLAFGYLRLAGRKGYALQQGSPAPGFRLPALAGGERDLASLRGETAFVEILGTLRLK